MNLSERGQRLIEQTGNYFKKNKVRTGIFFAGTVITISGGLAIGECAQNGNYELVTSGAEIVGGEAALTLVAGDIAGRINRRNGTPEVTLKENENLILEDKTNIEESNFSKTDSKI